MAFNNTLGPGGLTSIKRVLDLPDPMLTFKWVCVYLPFDFNTAYVEAISVPWNNIAVDDKQHTGSGFTYYPGTHDISAFSMTFYEDNKASALKFIRSWKELVKDFNSGRYGLPYGKDGYKQNVVIRLLDAKNEGILEVTLQGVWPSDTNNWDLNYTSVNDRITLQQNFSVDGQDVKYIK